jgi:hypothetical protein
MLSLSNSIDHITFLVALYSYLQRGFTHADAVAFAFTVVEERIKLANQGRGR